MSILICTMPTATTSSYHRPYPSTTTSVPTAAIRRSSTGLSGKPGLLLLAPKAKPTTDVEAADSELIRKLREMYVGPWGGPIPPPPSAASTQRRKATRTGGEKAVLANGCAASLERAGEKRKDKEKEPDKRAGAKTGPMSKVWVVPASPPRVSPTTALSTTRPPLGSTPLSGDGLGVCPACSTPLPSLRRSSSSSNSLSSEARRPRSPLFDDDEEDDEGEHWGGTDGGTASGSSSPSNSASGFSRLSARSSSSSSDNGDRGSSTGSPSALTAATSCSPSPSPVGFPRNPSGGAAGTKWAKVPSHRRVLLLEAKSWPIFASPPSPPPAAEPRSAPCSCGAWSRLAAYGQSFGRSGVEKSEGRRASEGMLVAPKAEPVHGPLDPLSRPLSPARPLHPSCFRSPLSTSPKTLELGDPLTGAAKPIASSFASSGFGSGRSGVSLLTKSLRNLGSRLPNLQWGLSPLSSSTGSSGGQGAGLGGWGGSTTWAIGLPGEEFAGFSGMAEGEWSTGIRTGEEGVTGRQDPEMEWSSMIVQLQTFSSTAPPSPPTSPTSPTSAEVPCPPAPSPPPEASKTQSHRGRSRIPSASSAFAASPPRPGPAAPPTSAIRTPGPSRVGPPPATADAQAAGSPPSTRRLVSNPYHLLQLTLELEMMRVRKIRRPLRPRSVKVVAVPNSMVDAEAAAARGAASTGRGRGVAHLKKVGASGLRHEVR